MEPGGKIRERMKGDTKPPSKEQYVVECRKHYGPELRALPQVLAVKNLCRCSAWSSVQTPVEVACAAARSDRFICIYPTHLNNKTRAEGRRIPISKAVENPTATEIQDVCSAVGVNAFLEKIKMYSREWNGDVEYRGRVQVRLKQDNGSLCLVQFPSRKSVMLYAAEMIPKLKTKNRQC
ncbi:signal recognition particle 19 kDa protein-like [Peromyscus californicus insignis]|uniref:signal recognition particle 19 kDa protein-like n=1 Tax=Peromyscus californicus insignis TaxID=564181 RepID=UPI0022A6CAA3|nr:signal recognition particle 19 kDa protein-like [Peromyscus californicus insignis]